MADKKKKQGQPTPQQHRNNVRTTEKYNTVQTVNL
jgi:hypothetical protein